MATKKITELPLINTISGSYSVVPIVIGNTVGTGTTDQISIENFSKFVTAYSAHTGSAGNTFTGPQTINNNVTITGNQNVNGNVTISGRLTVNEVYAHYETASIIYSDGSNKFGDSVLDKHEFTGSSNFIGSVFINGENYTAYSSSNSTLFTNYSSSDSTKFTNYSSSDSTKFTNYSSSNATYVTALSSSNSTTFTNFSSSNATYVTALSSSNSTTFTNFSSSNSTTITNISSSTANTINGLSSNVGDNLSRVYQTTASLNQFTGSQDSRNFVISQFTSSQYDTMARIYQTTSSLQSTTASLNQFTASQDSRNFTLSTVTGSLIGITNGLMAFTAALDNTYATDAQLYQLYQATRSIELHSGSMIGVTNGLMAYTSSNETWKTGIRGEISGIEAWTASLDNTYATDAQLLPILQATRSLELLSGSLIGITNGLMAFTAALDSTYATDAQLYQLYAETASIKAEIAGIEALTASMKNSTIVSSSTQVQNYDVFALNSNLYTSTGSLIGITNGLMALTASMKAEAIVSSSTQIQNYFTFAKTGSVNTFYGNQIITGGLDVRDGVTGSFKGNLNGTATYAGTVSMGNSSTNQNYAVVFTTAGTNGYLSQYTDAFGGMLYNPSTNKLTVSGSIDVSGSITITSGSITMPDRPAFKVRGTGGSMKASLSGAGLILSSSMLQTPDFNQGNHFNTTTGIFTAPIAGLYQVNLVVRTDTNTNNTINQFIVYKSGSATSGNVSEIMVEYGLNTTMNHTGGSTITKLEVGDTLKAALVVGSGSFDSNDNFSVAYIG